MDNIKFNDLSEQQKKIRPKIDAAICSKCSTLWLLNGMISCILGFPSVSVPVLSKAIALIEAGFSR